MPNPYFPPRCPRSVIQGPSRVPSRGATLGASLASLQRWKRSLHEHTCSNTRPVGIVLDSYLWDQKINILLEQLQVPTCSAYFWFLSLGSVFEDRHVRRPSCGFSRWPNRTWGFEVLQPEPALRLAAEQKSSNLCSFPLGVDRDGLPVAGGSPSTCLPFGRGTYAEESNS